MRAIETWLVTTPKTRGKSFDDAQGGTSGNQGEDFARVMQATLAPNGQAPRAKNLQRLNDSPTAKGALTVDYQVQPTSNDVKTSTAEAPLGKPGATRKSEKIPTGADDPTQSGGHASTLTPETPVPVPIFLSVPLFMSVPPPVATTGGPNQAGQSTLAAADSIFGSKDSPSAASVLPASGKATPGTSGLTIPTLATLPMLNAEEPIALSKATETGKSSPETGPDMALVDPAKEFRTADNGRITSDGLASALEPHSAAQTATATDNSPFDINAILTPPADGQANDPSAKILAPHAALSPELTPPDAGTGVANMESLMKNLQKTNKVAGLDVKVLPVGQDGQTGGNNLPQLPVAPVRSAENHGTDLNLAFSNGNNHSFVTENTTALNVVDLPSLADARARALDRAHDMVALHTMRLVESKSDVLSVVIKPAVGTELSLELRQDRDGVKAQANLVRGDHQFLNQHWPELQQRLEQRGIKLAPLGGDANFSGNDNSQFQKQHPSQEDMAQQASAFAEFAAASQVRGATARLATVHDGWQSWA